MRIIGYGVLGILSLYAAAVGVLAAYQRRMIYPGAFQPVPQAMAAPSGTEAVTVTTSDGERLHGLWAPPKPGCGVVLTFHGNGSVPESHAARFADAPWTEAGWGMLAIAYRGYTGSTGSPTETGLIEDGLAAYRFVGERAPGSPILLHGHSLGAAVAVAVGEHQPHLGLYLEAPFDSMTHAASLHVPYAPVGLVLLDTYRSDRRIAHGRDPVLIVHGAADTIVPAELGRDLAAAAGARAKIEVIPGDHVSILGLRDREVEASFRAKIPGSCGAARAMAR
ncbi:alpha/beta hydrolase [Methylobacterium sp. C25]|uniref:alpha/beta hydrolase n=1 Tax=Methylobacterium sp. C25 TaxID=2721622 RepID=UPI001F16BD8A|nr:alpha/beta hydrolase [Methylobacterium sp. C25]MCE4222416.1 alpha/beta hydrolase [Methylobacterium sp. C25]